MDGSRFDAWTRRRFGLAAGGVVASLFGLSQLDIDDSEAKKGKKRCRNLGQNCRTGGKRECCRKKGLSCQIFDEGSDARRCCRKGFEPCTGDEQCCSQSCEGGQCLCKSIGAECGGLDPLCCSLNCGGGMTPTCQPA